MFTLLRRGLVIAAFIALLASNILTLTWSAATAALSGLLGALGVSTVHAQLETRNRTQARQLAAQKKRLALQQRQLRKVGGNIRARTVKSAAANIGSLPAEAVPLLGWAVVVGVTAYELTLACDNLRDLDSLYRDMGIDPEADREVMDLICNPDLTRDGRLWTGAPERLHRDYGAFQAWSRGQANGEAPP
ncbi:hypothetical protein [Parahaliea mediterranea]|uniref:Uncharacterized protein n=1 Tax=Parahaliea mediterranea TaxID=651086 RepID=A0A939DH37_9GAMM|nr:hypothetical protein [Parahaliea mediterranea]MBN7798081.1 hypothetical protein [Parahaliea mediterranea]